VNETHRCNICRHIATHQLLQVYCRDGRTHSRTLCYCDGCYEQLHRRHRNNWLNGRRIGPRRDAPDYQVRPEPRETTVGFRRG